MPQNSSSIAGSQWRTEEGGQKKTMAEPRTGASTTVIRRVFLAQIALLGAVGALVVVGLYVSEHLGSFPLSFCAGCLGGSIALLKRLPGESDVVLDELFASRVTSIMPMLYGGLMAVVAYLLFMSGILTGDGGTGLFTSNLFPNFTGWPRRKDTCCRLSFCWICDPPQSRISASCWSGASSPAIRKSPFPAF